MHITKITVLILSVFIFLAVGCNNDGNFMNDLNPIEWSIADTHKAIANDDLTCTQLVRFYLERIDLYDQSTSLNSIILTNPDALSLAENLDTEYQVSGNLRPLHCVPMIIKDNFNTAGLQTTAGSVALKGFEPVDDATQVKKLKDAGAIVLAKSNMAEWAFSPMHTVSSIAGTTRNPYNTDHVPAGSSGGTAAAVAANLGLAGMGSDTGNSIRGPSSHNALVGFRTTMGLTSRYGIVPLYLRNDVGGPMTRTVEDAVRILDVTAGYDSADPLTEYNEGRIPDSYLDYLNPDGLEGVRIGVLRQLSDDKPHAQIRVLFEEAITDLENLGAEIIDPFEIPDFDSLRSDQWCAEFSPDIAAFLETHVQWDSLRNIDDIINFGGYSEFVESRLLTNRDNRGRWGTPEISCGNAFSDSKRLQYREAIENEMDRLGVDAIIYPSWNHPPARIEHFSDEYQGDNSQIIAPHTGQPAFTVPMGFTQRNLPAGLQILGRMFDETTLIQISHAYEQATLHRKPPEIFQ